MTNLKLFNLVVLMFSLTLISCKKKGCTDKDAKNYDSKATENNFTCTYEGSFVVWTKPPYAGIDIYIENVFKGNVGVTFSSAPTCGATGALTIIQDLGKEKSKTVKLHGIGKGILVGSEWMENISFIANTCTALEIE